MSIVSLRQEYHDRLCQEIIRIRPAIKKRNSPGPYPNFADGSSETSVRFAIGIVNRLEHKIPDGDDVKGQTAGARFETETCSFLKKSFHLLQHVRPGDWQYETDQDITRFEQYAHLAYLIEIVKDDAGLKSALGGDYLVKPDIVIGRLPITDERLNEHESVVTDDENIVAHTPLRAMNYRRLTEAEPLMILHASISCQWSIRSDRAQNTKTKALNLIRNRKGNLPHIVAVTAEPLPTRLAALALGTGDLDCVYHFALPELKGAIEDVDNEDQLDMLNIMVEGRRLRDISDLPLDLAI